MPKKNKKKRPLVIPPIPGSELKPLYNILNRDIIEFILMPQLYGLSIIIKYKLAIVRPIGYSTEVLNECFTDAAYLDDISTAMILFESGQISPDQEENISDCMSDHDNAKNTDFIKFLISIHKTGDYDEIFIRAAECEYTEIVTLLMTDYGCNQPDLIEKAVDESLICGYTMSIKPMLNFSKLPIKTLNNIYQLAIREKYLSLIKFLLKRGVQPTADALAIAFEQEDQKMIEMLFDYAEKLSINIVSDKIILASITVHYDGYRIVSNSKSAVEFLVNKGVDIHIQHERILIEAVQANDLDLVEYLVNNANFDVKTQDNTALEKSINNNNLNMVKLLLKHGADPCGQNNQIILDAICSRNKKIINLLMARGADISVHIDSR